MTQGRDQLRNAELIVCEMRGSVGGPDNYNIGPPGSGGPPQHVQQGGQDMHQVFRTKPAMHPTNQGRHAWQQATPDRQETREAHRQGPGPQQQPDVVPVDVGNAPSTPEVHFLFYGGVRTFKIKCKGPRIRKSSSATWVFFDF